MTTAKTIPNDDEAAILARADEIRTERARVAAEECVTRFKPLLDLTASPAWQEVHAKLLEIAPALVTYTRVYMAVESLPRQMDLVSQQVPPEAREVPPVA